MTDPSGPTGDVVSVLRPGQHGAAAAAIAAGHADYPTFRHVFPDPPTSSPGPPGLLHGHGP